MTKIERVEAGLAGRECDRPPVSFWYHFGTQHEGGERIAELELGFFRYYDLDYLKLMNDYFYPMPEGKTELKTKDDLAAVKRFDVRRSPWAEQLKAIEIVARELENVAYFVDTVFDPWQILLRNLAGEHLMHLVESAPDALLETLDVITDNVVAYCKEALTSGAAGVFLSTFGASNQLPKEIYLRFAYPFVERIFAQTRDSAIMNTAHLHDYGIYVDECVNLPAHIISYEDTDDRNPSMEQLRKVWDGSIMGGMDKTRITRVTPEAARQNALAGARNGGTTKFFLAPGCSFPTWMFPESGKLLVEAVKALA